ncbi:MAG: hypothetical protein AB7O24_07245 [Kofleriaceae bacterium]
MKLSKLFISLLAIAPAACVTQADDVDQTGDGDGKADGNGAAGIQIKGSGFAALAGAEVRIGQVYSLGAGKARQVWDYDALQVTIAADGTFSRTIGVGHSSEAKLVAFIDADGVPGCSASDYLASVHLPANSNDAVLELTPKLLPLAESSAQELLDCNQAFAPRYHAKVSISGFPESDGRLMGVSTLPHPGYTRITDGGSGIGGGISSFNAIEALTYGYREKLIMFLEKDGILGCSEDDIIAAVITDPVTGPLSFAFSPTNLPRTSDPAQDLRDCNKFNGPDGIGEYDLTIRGAGFDAQEGKSVLFGSPASVLDTATVVGGKFEVTIPKYLWEAEDEGAALLIDGNGDGKCGDASDLSGFAGNGYVTADVVMEVTPDMLQYPVPQCW